VGVHDDFFAAGGDSLKAMALLYRLQRQLEHPFRPVTLLQAPTVQKFAAYLKETYPDLPAQLTLAAPQATVRTCPPSFVQRRFWTLQKLNPTDSFFNAPFVFRLCGELKVALLREGFNAIVRRHEVLRTTLQEFDGELTQVVAAQGEINLTVVDVQDDPVRIDKAKRMLRAETLRPFALAQEAGLRILLLQVERHEYLLQLCFHNTLFDQSSLLTILEELSAHYTALLAGTAAQLPAPAQYAEYVHWQKEASATQVEERQAYWRQWFGPSAPASLTWPPQTPPLSKPTFHSHVSWQHSAAALMQQLQALSQDHGVTTYMTLLAAYAILIARYTGCTDVTIGTTYSNRHHWRFKSLIGPTIQVPALRIDLSDNCDFLTLLSRVRGVIISALTYQDLPLAQVAGSGQWVRQPDAPLFRAVLAFFAETAHGRLQLPGLSATFLPEFINDVSRPELYLVLWQGDPAAGDGLVGYFMNRQDVFTADTAAQMNQSWQKLLAALVRKPASTVIELWSFL
jgi:hypothetical protein